MSEVSQRRTRRVAQSPRGESAFSRLLFTVLNDRFGGNKSALADALGMSGSALTRITQDVERGKSPSMSVRTLLKLASFSDEPLLTVLSVAGKAEEAEMLAQHLKLRQRERLPAQEADLLSEFKQLDHRERLLYRALLRQLLYNKAGRRGRVNLSMEGT